MSEAPTVTASNTELSVRDDVVETVNGDDDVITIGAGATLTLNGFSDTIHGSDDTLTMGSPGPINTVDGFCDTIDIVDNSVVAVTGGGNTFTQANGLLTLDDAGDAADTLNGTHLAVTVLAGSTLYLNGSIDALTLGADCLLVANGDNTNFFGSDDRIFSSGATVGGDSVTGADNRIFVGAYSQLVADGNNNFIHSTSHSSLGVTGTGERLVGTGFWAWATSGSDVFIGRNGANGAYDTLTASDITARIAADSNIILAGDDDTVGVRTGSNVYFVGTGLTAHFGQNSAVIINSNGETGGPDILNGAYFSVTVISSATVEMSALGASAQLAADVTLTLQRSDNTIHAGSSDTISILSGASNQVVLAADDVISDGGWASTFDVGGAVGATTLKNFGADPNGIIDLLNGVGGYATAQAAFAALTSDGAGGSMLSLGSNGAIDFAGATGLSAANFKIG